MDMSHYLTILSIIITYELKTGVVSVSIKSTKYISSVLTQEIITCAYTCIHAEILQHLFPSFRSFAYTFSSEILYKFTVKKSNHSYDEISE